MENYSAQRSRRTRSVLGRRPAIMGTVVSAVAAVGLLAAPAAASVSAPASHARTGRISGMVTAQTEGRGNIGIEDICVLAVQARPRRIYKAHTSLNGHYVIGSIAPGRYYVIFAGCRPNGSWLQQWYKGINSARKSPLHPPRRAIALRVRAGKTRFGIDAHLRLAGSGSIYGRVTAYGHPVCTTVFATPLHTYFFYYIRTNKTGHYSITSLPPGRYYVSFEDCSAAMPNLLTQWYKGVNSPIDVRPHGAVALRVRANKALTGIDARLRRGASVSGTVTSGSTGAPLYDICASATLNSNNYLANLENTAKDGRYVFYGLFPGTYRIEFGCAYRGGYNYAPQFWRYAATSAQETLIHISGAQHLRNIDGKLGPGGIITGTVRGTNASGPPLAGVCITAGNSDTFAQSATTTGTNGSYKLTSLKTGTYKLFFDPGCGGGTSYQGQEIKVKATAGSTVSGVNIYLQPAS